MKNNYLAGAIVGTVIPNFLVYAVLLFDNLPLDNYGKTFRISS